MHLIALLTVENFSRKQKGGPNFRAALFDLKF